MNDIPKEIINSEWRMPLTPYKTPELYLKSTVKGPDDNDIIKEEYPSNHAQGENDNASNKYGIDTSLFLTFWICGTLLHVFNGK